HGAHDTSYPNPGDLIEIKRQGYQHWALYVGDGYVIHVTAAGKAGATTLTGKLKVKKELLKEVTGNDNWDVNNKHDWYGPPFHWRNHLERLGSNCEHFVTTLRYGEGSLTDTVKNIIIKVSQQHWSSCHICFYFLPVMMFG
uniref:LRAT domain-containing protein n=1 Tax=Malurus cyaneus samueli TaxID=2593467 RepID=A0A8C5TZD0_9PASS